jgi:hypothetical protein
VVHAARGLYLKNVCEQIIHHLKFANLFESCFYVRFIEMANEWNALHSSHDNHMQQLTVKLKY